MFLVDINAKIDEINIKAFQIKLLSFESKLRIKNARHFRSFNDFNSKFRNLAKITTDLYCLMQTNKINWDVDFKNWVVFEITKLARMHKYGSKWVLLFILNFMKKCMYTYSYTVNLNWNWNKYICIEFDILFLSDSLKEWNRQVCPRNDLGWPGLNDIVEWNNC